MVLCPDGSWCRVMSLRALPWGGYCSISSSMTQKVRSSAPSASLQVTKLSSSVDIAEERDDLQRDQDKHEKWAHKNLIKIKSKWKVLHVGQGNPRNEYRLGKKSLKAILWRSTRRFLWIKC